ncbi:hypothetical protein [Microbacterium sp.]|uniref:hypothetical protein n=1 Tax=Microbacterium sp. TaxID=51671 RepID=UPI003C7417CD
MSVTGIRAVGRQPRPVSESREPVRLPPSDRSLAIEGAVSLTAALGCLLLGLDAAAAAPGRRATS